MVRVLEDAGDGAGQERRMAVGERPGRRRGYIYAQETAACVDAQRVGAPEARHCAVSARVCVCNQPGSRSWSRLLSARSAPIRSALARQSKVGCDECDACGCGCGSGGCGRGRGLLVVERRGGAARVGGGVRDRGAVADEAGGPAAVPDGEGQRVSFLIPGRAKLGRRVPRRRYLAAEAAQCASCRQDCLLCCLR